MTKLSNRQLSDRDASAFLTAGALALFIFAVAFLGHVIGVLN